MKAIKRVVAAMPSTRSWLTNHMPQTDPAAALTKALAAQVKAERAVRQACAALSIAPGQGTRAQILAVLSSTDEPLSLPDIAAQVAAMRNDVDEPKKATGRHFRGGSTRYTELCRGSLRRMADDGLVIQVGKRPARFQRRNGA